MTRIIFFSALIFAVLLTHVSLTGCSRKSQPVVEEPLKPLPPAPLPEAAPHDAKPAPPKPADVRAIVDRIFQTAVTVDAERPYDYMVGDFNGDGSQDIAMVVKPVESGLAEINSEVANWILEDPTKIPQPDPKKIVQAPPAPPEPVYVHTNDTLLAILHGFGPEGWRSPQSRQVYLLKGAVGAGLKVKPVSDLLTAAKDKENKPRLNTKMLTNGEVFQEVLNGKNGFIYYTGAKYVWYP